MQYMGTYLEVSIFLVVQEITSPPLAIHPSPSSVTRIRPPPPKKQKKTLLHTYFEEHRTIV